ncbi:MAG: PrsW family intramembrane metalloprotease [Bacteroidales bacterium]|jgi:RsiW-degrading membrane proteinase PrsW (M82 family)|nr:PrsW family intramembrane metalloprotease [Bacteroidales bacterium]
MLLVIITALIPVVILGWWIYKKDSLRPEPLRMLYKAFLYGVGSTFVTLVITSFLAMAGVVLYDLGSFKGAVSTALFAAALPEECAKLLMLWLFLRNNPYYDEYLDGIVYAACVGLGFAGTENILYLLQSDNWLGTGIMRGITAVPAHFAIACAMGYFYSKRHFGDRSRLTAVCVLAVPVIIHWVYDALAFSEGIFPALSVVINVLFVLLIWLVYRNTMRRISTMQQLDQSRMTPPPLPPDRPSSI